MIDTLVVVAEMEMAAEVVVVAVDPDAVVEQEMLVAAVVEADVIAEVVVEKSDITHVKVL